MSRSISESLEQLDISLNSCQTSLQGKEVEVEAQPKVSELPALIDSIQAGGGETWGLKYFSVSPSSYDTAEGPVGTYRITVSPEEKAKFKEHFGQGTFRVIHGSDITLDMGETPYNSFDLNVSKGTSTSLFTIALYYIEDGTTGFVEAYCPGYYSSDY